MKKTAILLTLIITISLFGGCKNTTDNNQPNKQKSASYDPCELLTAEDLQKYFPDKTAKITQHDKEADAVGGKTCFYSYSDEELIYAQLSITNQEEINKTALNAGQTAEKIFQNIKLLYDKTIDIEDIGYEAYFAQTKIFPSPEIVVLSPNKKIFFSIHLNLGDTNKDEARYHQTEKELAKLILNRL